jgi:hypothetical protein
MEPTREQLSALARQLAATAPHEIDCEVVLDRVASFVEATRSRDALAPELKEVAQHLEVCPSCLEEFQALLRALEME